ncbi:hypothetical protein ACWEO4_02450 [Streptomyces sp. NPDC004393]
MKLGKALATGVAEERPEVPEEETGLRAADVTDVVEEPAAPALEEVPAAR